jgi:hypothetical protein
MLKNSTIFILILFFINSCTFTDNDSFEPAYLILESPSLTTQSSEGPALQNITDAWVIVDGQLIGVFPLPAKVPVIPTGLLMEIQINAGVKQSANINSSVEYPFFNPFITQLKLESNKDFKIDMNFKYKPALIFDFIEGFENNSHILDNDVDGNPATRLNISDKDKSFGKKCGLLELDIENPDGEVASIPFYQNKNNKKGSVFLEFDYKSDVNLFVGSEVISSTSVQRYSSEIPASNVWKRAYVDLTKEISLNNVTEYRPLIGSTITSTSLTKALVYLDNVKLVHF